MLWFSRSLLVHRLKWRRYLIPFLMLKDLVSLECCTTGLELRYVCICMCVCMSAVMGFN